MEETAVPNPTGRRAAFAFIFMTLVLDVLALGVIIPVLPQLVKSFLADQAFDPGADGRFRRHLGDHPPRTEADFPIEVHLAGQVSA